MLNKQTGTLADLAKGLTKIQPTVIYGEALAELGQRTIDLAQKAKRTVKRVVKQVQKRAR